MIIEVAEKAGYGILAHSLPGTADSEVNFFSGRIRIRFDAMSRLKITEGG
jgi:hypothetical protein